jgi:hypothetical protein
LDDFSEVSSARRPPLTRADRWPRRRREPPHPAPCARAHRRCARSQAWVSQHHPQRERATPQRGPRATNITNATRPREFAGKCAPSPACQRDVCLASPPRVDPHHPDRSCPARLCLASQAESSRLRRHGRRLGNLSFIVPAATPRAPPSCPSRPPPSRPSPSCPPLALSSSFFLGRACVLLDRHRPSMPLFLNERRQRGGAGRARAHLRAPGRGVGHWFERAFRAACSGHHAA